MDYAGIPFVDRGRDRSGLDCWGLVRLIYQDECGVSLPDYGDRYDDQRAAADGEATRWVEVSPADVQRFDVLEFSIAGEELHVGVAIDQTRMIHASRSRGGVVVENFTGPLWRPKLKAIWRKD